MSRQARRARPIDRDLVDDLSLTDLMTEVARNRQRLERSHELLILRWRQSSLGEQLVASCMHAKIGRVLATLLARIRADAPSAAVFVRVSPSSQQWSAHVFVLLEGYDRTSDKYRSLCRESLHVMPYDEHERGIAAWLPMMKAEKALDVLTKEGWLP